MRYDGEDEFVLIYDEITRSFTMSTQSSRLVNTAYRDGLTIDYNRNRYKVDSALDHFPLDICDARIQEFFRAVGLNADLWIRHWGLDYETMSGESLEYHQDGTKTVPDHIWTEADNCYHCSVSQMCNRIPLIPSYTLQASADIINVGNHSCELNCDRFIMFSLGEIYEITYSDEWLTLMDFEEIVRKYKKYQEASSLLEKAYMEVTDITMRAIPVAKKDDGYELVPVWIFYGYVPSAYEEIYFNMINMGVMSALEEPYLDQNFAVIINAVTGEQL